MFSIVTIIFSFKFINYFINNISHIVINPNATCALGLPTTLAFSPSATYALGLPSIQASSQITQG
jgi:hypothetical protein